MNNDINNEVLITPVKKKMGRPVGTKKENGGKNLWIPSELLDTVQLLINAHKNRQAK